jgi:GT2 family glycosyltransferase
MTRRAVECLLNSGVPAHRIRLLDDGSTDEGWKDFSVWATGRGCAYERHEENQGYTANINRAFDDASKYVLLLNSDCLVRRADIEAMVAQAEAFPMLAGIGPVSNQAGSQSIMLSTDRSWIHLTEAEICSGIDYLAPKLEWKYGRRPVVVPSINGFCALWRTDAIREVGGFDVVNFPRGYGEEDDVCFRLMQAGWFCAIVPWIMAVHFKTQSFSAAQRDELKSQARTTLQSLHGSRFFQSVINHIPNHPLLQRMAIEPADL